MNMDSKVPEIRFKGFSTNWLNFNLSQITDVYDGTHQTPAYTKSGVMFLSAENIKSLTSTKFISEEAFKKEFKVYPKKNDVLMTRIGDVGTANVVETDDDRAYYVTLALLKYKKISPYFLKSSIASPFVQKDIWLRTLHIAFPKKINMNEIKQVAVNCPSDAVESEKIGQYFKNLDALITQHQQKHDKLSNIKKAMLEKMFPKLGETTPEIRFKGFSGEWEEVTLSSIIDVRSGKDYKHLGKGNIPVYGTGGYMLSVDSALSKYEDAIGIGRKGTIDKPYILRAPFWTVDTLFYAVPFPSFNLDFLFCLFQKIEWKKHDESTGVPSLSKIAINNVQVYATNELEQTTIGNYFQKLDALINQHQQQITKLNNIKQACLSKMFV